jgi:hypothetical protein
MAARRNVLNGASAWEREERANQQRDYAAQLQQQVRCLPVDQKEECVLTARLSRSCRSRRSRIWRKHVDTKKRERSWSYW